MQAALNLVVEPHSMPRTELGRIDVEGAAVSFKGPKGKRIEALAPTDLVIEPGSFVSLIGPSGCGKSTLLNAVGGFVPLSEGTIRLDGEPVTGINPDVGVVFQQYALFPWFTALGNVMFALKRFRLSKEERRDRAMAALKEVGLEGREANYPGQLSGGMRQRVALARTFVTSPKVLLMDEPFGALDAQTRVVMHEILLRVWEAHKATVIFVTHDVDEALILSDRAHIMSAGPGRIIETMEITDDRPRRAHQVTESFLRNRNHIIGLLRQPGADDH
ncbi:sulfonate ABC transporter ATP-binding protein [Roseivivax isoporae LMG 25204]|uniref:Sulfonate ABC transporter ATP-binding protein n=2 Tax=Roseivivax TaxID=93682 RepID=X7F4N0_9RHOB|nr:sulfonate ABC transporter ATP-binding protein [Roseivivax isoporae LMG 25204]